jgi:hypothetical protein
MRRRLGDHLLLGQPRDEHDAQRWAGRGRRRSSRCDRKNFGPCLDKLDEAAKLDPQGDKTDDVKQLRVLANAGLHPEPPVDAGKGYVKAPL